MLIVHKNGKRMKTYTYTNNKTDEIIVITSNCILEADKEYFKKTGINVSKHPYIGCSIKSKIIKKEVCYGYKKM